MKSLKLCLEEKPWREGIKVWSEVHLEVHPVVADHPDKDHPISHPREEALLQGKEAHLQDIQWEDPQEDQEAHQEEDQEDHLLDIQEHQDVDHQEEDLHKECDPAVHHKEAISTHYSDQEKTESEDMIESQ